MSDAKGVQTIVERHLMASIWCLTRHRSTKISSQAGNGQRSTLPRHGFVILPISAFDPLHSWKYLIEAQRWEHLAEVEINLHFQECNIADFELAAAQITFPDTP